MEPRVLSQGLLPLWEKVPEEPAPDLIQGRMRGRAVSTASDWERFSNAVAERALARG
jgi:hypothetical protein